MVCPVDWGASAKGGKVFRWGGNMFPCQQVRPTGKSEECGRTWCDERKKKTTLHEGKVTTVWGKTLAHNISKDSRARERARMCELSMTRVRTCIPMCTFMILVHHHSKISNRYLRASPREEGNAWLNAENQVYEKEIHASLFLRLLSDTHTRTRTVSTPCQTPQPQYTLDVLRTMYKYIHVYELQYRCYTWRAVAVIRSRAKCDKISCSA